ncbi:tol-pal system-associated acyl-CoA thioesterase [Aestuariivirga sp.]|uniref:tol-pal system-associated acyl-CoA thioesterase n=1 Tax=Aestuariivirga sp. TaxID=2650926 RepID=UPI0025BA2776|nr:tol-pal system-associated acyl-CoA thioesterase [Aestuariivirga sp.]MCA3556605.1 tol-pal system-associated acyl-CoA thioesterase [Aestuariivirga sp.]
MTEEAWPGFAGRIGTGIHIKPIRVYFEDTDAGGVVYHARYAAFCERARSDCLRLLGIRQSQLENLNFVVRRMVCDFLGPARLDDLLEVHTRFIGMTGARIEIGQDVMRDGALLFRAAVTVALVDREGRPKRFPKEMTARFSPLTGASGGPTGQDGSD